MLTIKAILDSRAGKAATAFARVAAAAAFGAWAMAGFPLSQLTGGDVEQYVQAGLAAGAALVGVNAVAPWETRYGRRSGKQGER
jgi:hypothetical protein